MEWLVSLWLLFIWFVGNGYNKHLLFNFGIIALWCCSLLFQKQRSYRSVPLGLFLLLALVLTFYHADMVSANSIIVQYLNIYVLANGFCYFLVAVMLLKLVVEYTKRWYAYLPALAVVGYLWFRDHRFTVPMAFAVSLLVYLAIKKRWKLFSGVFVAIMVSTIANWTMICNKFSTRPYSWSEMWRCFARRFLLGEGAANDLYVPEGMIWVTRGNYGWLFKHNDYLHLGMAYGLFAVILILWFLIETYWRLRNRFSSVLILTFMLASFFQFIMGDIRKASFVIVLFGLIIAKEINGGASQDSWA